MSPQSKAVLRQRLGLRRRSAAFSPATTMRKRQGTGAVQNLEAKAQARPNCSGHRSERTCGEVYFPNCNSFMSYTICILSKGLSAHAAYYEILDAIWARHFPVTERGYEIFWRKVSALSTGEQAFVVANDYYGETNCNGFEGYFLNTNCQQAHQTEKALRLFGLDQAADFLSKALIIGQVPTNLPPDFFYEWVEERKEAFKKLDKDYRKSKAIHGFHEAVVNYVRTHPDQFI